MNQPHAEQLYVIYNPSAGRGRALARLQEQLTQLTSKIVLKPTDRSGHAEELAFEAANAGCLILARPGAMGRSTKWPMAFCGRANRIVLWRCCRLVPRTTTPIASASSPTGGAMSRAAVFRQVDVGLIETNTGAKRYFVNGAGIGLNGAVTLEARSIRGLQGVLLYSTAMLRALWKRYRYPDAITDLDGVRRERTPTLAFSAAIGKREGNFLLAPDAQVDDGLFDYLHAGPIKWWEVLRYLPAMIRGRLPDNHPALWRGRCREIRVQAEEDLIIHLDGEMFAVPGDGVSRCANNNAAGSTTSFRPLRGTIVNMRASFRTVYRPRQSQFLGRRSQTR